MTHLAHPSAHSSLHLFDLLVMRVADIALAFPSIVSALAIASVLGPSLKNAVIAMILVWRPEYARLMRGQVLSALFGLNLLGDGLRGAFDPRLRGT